MPQSYACNSCNTEFSEESSQKLHYRSEWHRYNLRRKVAGVPGVTEALFNLRLEALAKEHKSAENEQRMLYKCVLCGKEYSTEKAHAQHLRSKLHSSKVAAQPTGDGVAAVVIRPAPARPDANTRLLDVNGKAEKSVQSKVDEDEDGSDGEWEEVDGEENEAMAGGEEEEEAFDGTWDVSQCFFCDLRPDGTLDGCVEHMHKAHGFFIPDSEYLKDPEGLLTYLALKVTKGYMCLYCDLRGKRFQSLEAVRKHMVSKSHCKLLYADGEEEGAEEELEEYYDFSSSYMVEGNDSQLVAAHNLDVETPVSLCSSGFELMIKSADGKKSKTIGSRELFRYYRQRPKPSEVRNDVLVNVVVAKYRSLGLVTQQPNFRKWRRSEEVGARMASTRAEAIRTRIALKNNVIRNLPRNCPH